MKKIILAAAMIFAAGSTFAQDYDKTKTISAFMAVGPIAEVGVYLEGKTEFSGKTVWLFGSIAYAEMTYEEGLYDITGNGYNSVIGWKSYFSKNKPGRGFYYANSISNGKIKFDPKGDAYGEYQYWSFLSPEIGWKIMIGSVALDPFIGVKWRIEVKGKGFIDNRNTDNWVPKLGLRLGYSF